MKQKVLQMLLLGMFAFLTSNALAQLKVSGIVKSSDGEALPGATVVVKGTSSGVITDFDGKYTITIPNAQSTLVFSFVGMQNQEIAVNGKPTINVTLSSVSIGVDEVVVTALGMKKSAKALGYNVNQVNSDKLETGGASNALKALEGKVTGVQMNSLSSSPNSSVLFNIRGATSLNGILAGSDGNVNNSSQPLIVIDGIPVGSNEVKTTASVDVGNRITSINPNDIESVSILKGASAAALYGSSAGNGVIMITTKSGSKAKKGLGISVTSEIAFSQVYNAPPVQRKFFQGDEDGTFNPSSTNGLGFAVDDKNNNIPVQQWDLVSQSWKTGTLEAIGDKNPVTAFLETGVMATNNVSITGNYDKGSYRFNYGNVTSKLVIPYNQYKRNDVSFNANYKVNDKISISSVASYSHTFVPQQSHVEGNNGDNPISLALQTPVNLPKMSVWKDADRFITGYKGVYQNSPYLNNAGQNRLSKINKTTGKDDALGADNPYHTAQYNIRTYGKDVFFGKAQLDWSIINPLRFSIRSGVNYESFGFEHKIPWDSRATGNRIGGYEVTETSSLAIRSDAMLAFNKNFFNDKLSVDALGGVNYNFFDEIAGVGNYTNYSTFSGTDGLTTPNSYNFSSISQNSKNNAKIAHGIGNRNYSVYATASLGWNGMVYVDLSGRNDWTGILDHEKDNHFYPGVSLSWLISETFKEQLPSISLLKVRGGYAETGYGIGRPINLDTYGTSGSTWGGAVQGTVGGDLVDTNIKPELNKTKEIGLDFGLFKNRVSGEFTAYQKRHVNQIQNLPVVSSSGFSNVKTNMGSVKSTGIEASLTVVPIRTNDLEWNITANVSTFKSIIEKIDKRFTTSLVSYSGANYMALFEGARVGDLYAKQPLPVVQSGKYKGSLLIDSEGTGDVSDGFSPDMIRKIGYLGNINPKAILGFSTNVKYKNWDFGVVTSLRLGGVFVSETAKRLIDNGLMDMVKYFGKDYGKYFVGGRFAGGLKSMPNPDAVFAEAGYEAYHGDTKDRMEMYNGDPRYFGYMNAVFLDPTKVDLDGLSKDQMLSQGDGAYIKNGDDPNKTFYYNPYYMEGQNAWGNTQFRTSSATNFKIKEINVTYNVDRKFADKLHCQNIAFTAFAKNIMFWTKNNLHEDPETAFNDGVNGFGIANFGLPPVRTMGLKIAVGF